MSYKTLKDVFNSARRLPPGLERDAFIISACGEDSELRKDVEKLLRAQDQMGPFLATTAMDHELAGAEKIGSRIGCYRLVEEIGEGGWGTVYLAEQEEPVCRKVALKILKLGMDTRSVIARFEAERQALAMMDHPNIAAVHDAGTTETGRPFFVMEWVQGDRITDYCERHQLSIPARLELFIQVCQAVQHAHQKGIIHRDLKPSNILVATIDGSPVPKVIDFGIAKATTGQQLTDKTIYTLFDQFIGTPDYISPEQARLGDGFDIDTRSDIYSLGVLLYELLAGRPPFEARDLAQLGMDELRRRIREEDPPKPSARVSTFTPAERAFTASARGLDPDGLLPALRGDLDWIALKCMEKDRIRRYDTANALAMDLRRHLSDEPVLASPPTTAYRAGKFVRRHRVGVSAGALILAALLGATGVSLRMAWIADAERDKAREAQASEEMERQRAEDQAAVAQQQTWEAQRNHYAADINLAAIALERGNIWKTRSLLDRHRPSAGGVDLRGWEWRYLWREAQGEEIATISAHGRETRSVAFSEDGRRMVTAAGEETVRIWDVDTRDELEAISLPGGERIRYAEFRPGRDQLILNTHGAGLFVWDLESQSVVAHMKSSRNEDGFVVCDGGDQIAVVAADFIVLWNPEEDRVREIPTGHYGRLTALQAAPSGEFLASGGIDRVIRFWDVRSGELLFEMHSGHDSTTSALGFSPDGSFFATGSVNGRSIVVYQNGVGEVARFTELTTGPHRLRFSPQGNRLVAGGMYDRILVYDTAEWVLERELLGHESGVFNLVFSPDGKLMASTGGDGRAKLWNLDKPSAKRERFAVGDDAQILTFSPDFQYVAVLEGGVLAVHETRTFRRVAEHTLREDPRVLFSALCHLGLSKGGDLLHWHSCRTSRRMSVRFSSNDFRETAGNVVAISDDEHLLLEVSREGETATFRLATVEGDRELARISAAGSCVDVALSRQNRWVVWQNWAQPFQVWEVPRGIIRAIGRGFDTRAEIVVSPSEVLLAVASGHSGGAVEVWHLESGDSLATLPVAGSAVAIAIDPEETRLAVLSRTGMITIWNLENFRELMSVTTEMSSPHWMGFIDEDVLVIANTHEWVLLDASHSDPSD